MKTSIMAACIVAMTLPAAQIAKADPAVGASLTYVFGTGVGAGLRLFSNDEEDELAGSIGIDYNFGAQSFRPNLGLNYLFEDGFIGGDIGSTGGSSNLDFGLTGGFVNTQP